MHKRRKNLILFLTKMQDQQKIIKELIFKHLLMKELEISFKVFYEHCYPFSELLHISNGNVSLIIA